MSGTPPDPGTGQGPAGAVDRRALVRAGAAMGAVLLIHLPLPRNPGIAAGAGGEPAALNAWLRITGDGRFVFVLDRVEMGQGVMTALPAIFGEEFDLDPARFEIEFAPADRRYDNPDLMTQMTGGSTSVHAAWGPLRLAGATARARLMTAAARSWSVPVDECATDNGVVLHKKTGKTATYGDLAAGAAEVDPEKLQVTLRTPEAFRYIGKSMPRREIEAKVTGNAAFGIDIAVDGALAAYVLRAPRIAARFDRFAEDPPQAASPAGVAAGLHGIYPLDIGVAVVAASWWQAKRLAESLKVEWKGGLTVNSPGITADFADAATQKGEEVRAEGMAYRALVTADKRVEAVYELPFLAHAPMEPQNCTARVTDGRCEVWAPTQAIGLARQVAAQAAGIPEDRVTIHGTLLGGGFGRRLSQDYVREAVLIAKAAGVAVQLIWSREQDMRNSPCRPCSYHLMEAGLDAAGVPVAWRHRIVAPSILAQLLPDWAPAMLPGWVPAIAKKWAGRLGAWVFAGRRVDDTAVEGAKELPYSIPNLQIDYVHRDPGVPVGFWRSVGHSYTAFAVESFVDELAAAAGQDPLAFRTGMLTSQVKNRVVLERAAARFAWARPLAKGRARGIAQHASFRSYAATAVEVEVVNAAIKVHRVVTAVDCGRVVNPDMVRAQVESATVFALTAALKGSITLEDGGVKESNFHDYELLRLAECPEIEVEIVESDSDPTGVGEPGVPPVAPAVANAVFAATGRRLRQLPLRLE